LALLICNLFTRYFLVLLQ